MRRRVLNLLTALSLLLCVAASALWARSYFRHDSCELGVESGGIGLDSCRGTLVLLWIDLPPGSVATLPFGWRSSSQRAADSAGMWAKPSRSFAGLGVARIRSGGVRFSAVSFPHWLLALTAAVLPVVRGIRRRAAATPGLCRSCGYDLRATPGRCPECGMAAASQEMVAPRPAAR